DRFGTMESMPMFAIKCLHRVFSLKPPSSAVKTQRQPDGSYLVFLADGESGLRIFRFIGPF
ncbi:MAG: hypothetical protein ABSC60_07210, partial [Acidobacteriota bacterium]